MKKRILLYFCFLMAISVCFLSGCSTGVEQNPRLSELRSDIFAGESSGFKISVVTGMRETPFAIDGHSQKEKVYFTVITVTPDIYIPAAEYTFGATVGEKQYEGKLARHPFNQTYSAEINALAEQSEIDISITGSATAVVKATSIRSENFIEGTKAYSIALSELKKTVDEKAKEKDYEIFVRLIDNPINVAGGNYWYVAFVFEDSVTYGVLIDPVTMEIKAVKDKK